MSGTIRYSARVPHARVRQAEHIGFRGVEGRVSTHDLAGKGRFCLLTGISGETWAEAAAKVAQDLGIELAAHVIGPGREHIDLYEDRARAREVGEDGCVLVRPDLHVAWRSAGLVDDLGEPVPGLYGVGNCVASASAQAYRAGGATLGPIIAFAHRAATAAHAG
ncbi:aromatic-ring hydroxylase C-terminal domain-containing protein [Pseudonocardia sp. DLS-67]